MFPASSTASTRVPSPLTPLVGRDGRVDRAAKALAAARLLTLTGPGGCGKTRLAIEVASQPVPSRQREEAVWVELAGVSDPRGVADHVAMALGAIGRKAPLDQIAERFGPHAVLLVLDNCEHVVDAVATLVAHVLRECPAVRVLATSREGLGVTGERTFIVAPLSLPEGDPPTREAAAASDAMALFVERARDVRSDFALTDRNTGAVARICRRLDGIPLAIELAAARVRAVDPIELAARLDAGVGLLDTASRTAEPRHRTIRDTIDWSYRLLTAEECAILRRLAVFHGSFSLDAIESVCGEAGNASAALDLITGLLDKSLVLCDAGDAGTRYRLLETVREYARERLQEAGETDGIRERHARFFVALAEHGAPSIFGGTGDESWLLRLDEETPNLREALDWCEQQASRLNLALRLGVALHWHWYARGRFNEGRLRIGVALAFAEGTPPLVRGRALSALGRLAIWQGDAAAVHAPMEEAVALLTPLGDRASLAYALSGLGIAACLIGELAEARRLIDEAATTADAEAPEPLSGSLEYWRGIVTEWDHDWAGALRAFDRALAVGRRIGHRTLIAHALCAKGRLAVSQGQHEDGRRALVESLGIFRDLEDQWGQAQALLGCARFAAATGQAAAAATAIGAADGIRERLGIDLTARDRTYQDSTIALALTHVGEPAFWQAWGEGRTQPPRVVIAAELGEAAPPSDAAPRPAAAASTAVDLRVRALGPLEVHAGGRRVEKHDWGSSRARELLVFLLCHPDGCTKSQIGLSLWPDASPVQLRNTFHVTLHRLRGALRIADAIQADDERYRINPSLTWEFDAELFEREARAAMRDMRNGKDASAALAAAVARYQDDFLVSETAGEWAEERRERLQQLRCDALHALGRALMDRERYADAVEAFAALLAVDPVNEDACRRQMMCLSRLGDSPSALRAFDALARALRNDLGVQPSREIVAFRDKLAVNGL